MTATLFAISGLSACLLFAGEAKKAAPSRAEVQTEIARLSSEDDDERQSALDRLSAFGPSAAIPVVESLKTAPEEIRPTLARLLGNYQNPKSITPILRHLGREKSLNMRRNLIRALGKIGKRAAAEAIAEHLGNEREIAGQRDCLLALADTGSPRAMDTILKFAGETEEDYLREISFRAMKQLTGNDQGKDLVVWGNWWRFHREEVLKRAGESDDAPPSTEES